MTVTIGILIGSSSLDDKWQDANLSYQNIYKAFKIYNRKRKRGEIESFGLLPLFSFHSICFSSHYDGNQFFMIRYMHVSESQKTL